METPIQIPRSAYTLMTLLKDKDFEVVVVGGYVRDMLLQRPAYDIDLATNASSVQMIDVFKDYPLSKIGERLGTIGVMIDKQWIEITTYRFDGSSSNSRHPDTLHFINTLKEDVLRRDFTINALALDIQGNLIDYIGGLEDLIHQRIRAIGVPLDRFKEDALRLLRALRLAAQLNFRIEPETSKAILIHQDLIQTLPIERISVELDKLIQAKQVSYLFKTYRGILSFCIDFNLNHLDVLETFDDRALRYLCLLDHLDEPSIKAQLERLKLSKTFIKKVLDLKTISEGKPQDRYELKCLMGKYGTNLIDLGLLFQKQLGHPGINEALYNQLKSEMPCVSLKTLAINGHDLVALGISGKKLKVILEALLSKVMKDEISNDKTSLSLWVKELP